MSVFGGNRPTLVTSDMVYAVNLTGSTTVTSDTGNIGPYGGYQLRVTHDNSGCGGPDSRVYLELKNDIGWKYISCEFVMEGTAACWGFNDGTYAPTGNIASYDESQGDIIPNYRAQNSWENTTYQSHNKITACDNEANNFFRFNGIKKLLMKRRISTANNRAGIGIGRSCSSTGSGSYTIIRNIRVW